MKAGPPAYCLLLVFLFLVPTTLSAVVRTVWLCVRTCAQTVRTYFQAEVLIEMVRAQDVRMP